MSDYTSFFLNASGAVVPLECIELSHPSFSKIYRYVKNDEDGITAGGASYTYQPMSIKRNNVTNDLDQVVSVTFADMDDELIKEIMKIRTGANSKVRPEFVYKVFRDDDLSAPMIQLQTLEIATVSKDSTGLITFDAKAPELNSVRTGLVYTFEDYPLLKGI